MKGKILSAVIMGVMLPVLFSCSENNDGQQTSGPATLAIQGTGENPESFTLTNVLTSTTIGIKVEATEITGNMLSVSLKVDLALVDAYNTENSTDYLPLPVEAFEWTKSSVIFPQYNTVSSTAELLVDASKIAENGEYLLPVTIEKIDGEDGTLVEEGKDVVYFLIIKDYPEYAVEKVYTLTSFPEFVKHNLHGITGLPDGKLAVTALNDYANTGANAVWSLDPATGTASLLVNTTSADSWPYGIEVIDNDLYIGYKAGGWVGRYDLSSNAPGDQTEVVSGYSNILDLATDEEGSLYVLARDQGIFKYPSGQFNADNKTSYYTSQDGQVKFMGQEENGDMLVYESNGFFRVPADGGEPQFLFGAQTGDVDGAAADAQFQDLYAFDFDPDGNIWVVDYAAGKVKLVHKGESDDYSDATVETIVGGGKLATLNPGPRGVCVNGTGDEIYFTAGNLVYKITVTEK